MLDDQLLTRLQQASTPSILNGLKKLGVNPRDLQTITPGPVNCVSPDLGPSIGYASTRVIVTTRDEQERPEVRLPVYQGILEVPAPRFLVALNIGDPTGPVCLWGEILANVNAALGCVAGLTNGRVRDVPEMSAAGFNTFAGGIGPGGGYVDIVEVNTSIDIEGLVIAPGDLLHGDRHGIVNIPIDLATELPGAIEQVTEHEQKLIALCQSPEFSLDELIAALA